MQNKIEIYKIKDKETVVKVQFEQDSVWLTQKQMSDLFEKDVRTINEHIKNIYKTGELSKESTIRKFRIVRQEGKRTVSREIEHYNLDTIISVGYRVNSVRGTQFRIWATQRLKDYLVKGYAINEKRLAEKKQEVEYLKTGIRILNRAIEAEINDSNTQMLNVFAKGLQLLDDYDHQTLDKKGLKSSGEIFYPSVNDYLNLIKEMYSGFESDVFAKPKDKSFNSSVNQIRQSFHGQELYPTIEEKAANLLYYIVKNHSFVDGNKRIAAACFLFFLEKNNSLIINGKPIISNDALASLTLFIATSKSDEADIVKRLIISILNRNK